MAARGTRVDPAAVDALFDVLANWAKGERELTLQ